MRGLTRARARAVRAAVIVAAVVPAALALAGPAAAAEPVERRLSALVRPGEDGLDRALAAGRVSQAQYALERALALFRPERARRLYGRVGRPDPREGTEILRDLAARVQELSPRGRVLAERILARPTDRRDAIHGYRTAARRACAPELRFWWVRTPGDAPDRTDRNCNGIPDWVDTTRSVWRAVWRAEVRRFRYRAPRSDATSRNHGVNGKLDVYVADVGAHGLFGYCTSDDPARGRRRSVSSYCVVDDDFSRSQFKGRATGVRALKVTAAHEFFHAVQYGYDWREDPWLMEGSAVWIEDEIYDSVNDNRVYLRTSPLGNRLFWYPLDYDDRDPSEVEAGFKYGAWIFWRYLSERFGRDVVRAVWRRASASAGAPNEYSLRAVVSVLAARGVDFTTVFSDFGVGNLFPAATYSEGAGYPSPRPTRTISVTPAGVGRTRVRMYHLSNDYYAFVPADLAPATALTLTLDLPAPSSSRASAVVERADGSVERIPATRDGLTSRWHIVVADFTSARRVVLALTNASTRYTCWSGTVYSCRGRPLGDSDFYFEASVE